MSKKLGDKEGFRVVVEPRSLTDFGSIRTSPGLFYPGVTGHQRWLKEMEERCHEIAADIKRHANNVGHVSVEFDQEPICEHCNSRWTEKRDDYNGGCCDKDEGAEEARLAAAEALATG